MGKDKQKKHVKACKIAIFTGIYAIKANKPHRSHQQYILYLYFKSFFFQKKYHFLKFVFFSSLYAFVRGLFIHVGNLDVSMSNSVKCVMSKVCNSVKTMHIMLIKNNF